MFKEHNLFEMNMSLLSINIMHLCWIKVKWKVVLTPNFWMAVQVCFVWGKTLFTFIWSTFMMTLKKESHTGLERHEGEQMMTDFLPSCKQDEETRCVCEQTSSFIPHCHCGSEVTSACHFTAVMRDTETVSERGRWTLTLHQHMVHRGREAYGVYGVFLVREQQEM